MNAGKALVAIALLITVSSAAPLTVAAPKAKQSAAETPTSKPIAPLPPFEFRGHKIGEPVPAGCSANKLSLKTSCDDSLISGISISKREIGGVPIQVLSYDYYKNSLTDVMVTFHKNFYTQIHSMLIGKYGEPTHEALAKVETQGGVSFDNITSEWAFTEGTLRLEMLGLDINTSSLVFDNPTASAQIRDDEAAINRAKGGSAF